MENKETNNTTQEGFKFNYTKKEKAKNSIIAEQELKELGIKVY